MCLMCYESVRLKETTTCQCRQLKLNPLSTEVNIYLLMTSQTPVLLVQCEKNVNASCSDVITVPLFFSLPPKVPPAP